MAIAAARQSSQDGYHVVSRGQLFDRIAGASPEGLPSGFRDATEAVAFAMDFLQPWRDSPASNRTGLDP
ncbi:MULTISPECIES: hypothetical protein [unclassified Mesorhizobium]|nr:MULTISPECIES: hypothetical protein [unclassified Mesorhizobium]AZO06794.1 hypothetical protein EJ068_29865 [Mesorhizobium sp. M2A.F.Ca.ET.043.02.1.1]RUW30930.1 hypothetical protein EOA37_33330 [Mesorhizobium sp. M2A.F.Ca.ET.015.02.1.1]RUW70496.1 hypothetical protein EOA28_23655 [Mesorhizobium sp. M2A.F.Ca.ET.067.02.1.1]RVC91636.1 hypothetical protein EN739_28930 [Mesorhizobium sp. M2A.F.Ca.ET.017.03.2.1]RVD07847.1 hypothetical protein EN753_16420 [Mesorhizobium sp. M2A.F.Ca.ET.029.05.1.1]